MNFLLVFASLCLLSSFAYSAEHLPSKKVTLSLPPLEEVAKVLDLGLKQHFANVSVTVSASPDLTQAPFNLAGAGLGGATAIADVGGVQNLIPLARRIKTYTYEEVAEIVSENQNQNSAFLLGASAGPFQKVGFNCELIPNALLSRSSSNQTFQVVSDHSHLAKVNSNDQYNVTTSSSGQFALLGNLFVSEGKPGPVLKIEASKRIGKDNFVTAIRLILANHYGEKPVSLGGTFLIKTGKAHVHIMPEVFSLTPLTQDEFNKWLRYFEMSSPLVCTGILHSRDPGLDLKLEHSHCASEHNQGGHYYYDTTPEDVSYVAYYNLAQTLVRIDPATDTGKD